MSPRAPQTSEERRRAFESYSPPVKDFVHQTQAKSKGARKWAFGYLMDQGTGKTKTCLDNACVLYVMGVIRALFILAPNDVGDQWAEEQIPVHVPKSIQTRIAVWDASRPKARKACEALCKPLPDRLHILIMNHEAMATERGRKLATKFLMAFKDAVMTAVDESHAFKDPSALRTRFLKDKVRPLSKVRRIMTGTPMDKPFDMFAQMFFLDPDILGFDSFVAFKHHYGEFAIETKMRWDPKLKRNVRQQYPTLQAYQRMDELQSRIEPYVFVVKKEECTDLPPKLYNVLHPKMSDAQQAVYDEMKLRGIVLLEKCAAGERVRVQDLAALTEDELADRLVDPSGRVEAQIKLVLSLRLRQISGGFVTDMNKVVTPIQPFATVPRFKSMMSTIEAGGHGRKFIVWSMFRPELVAIQEEFKKAGLSSVLVYGDTKKGERAESIAAFKRDPNTHGLVAHPRTLGTGMDFPMASMLHYFSVPPSSIMRTQSEDRAHRIGQKGTVNVYDYVSSPADAQALRDLKQKKNTADGILSLDAAQLAMVL